MISPDDHLHSRSIVDDGAADSGEKEPLRTEPFILDSIHGGQDKSNLDKKSKEQNDPLTKSSSASREDADDSDHDHASVGDHASTSSSASSSMSSAHSSACTSTEEGINKSSPRQVSTGMAAAGGSGSTSAALHSRNKTLATGYTAVYEPRPADILLGRGKPFQSHPGNQFMLHAVDQLRDRYLCTDRKGKHNIIEHVLGLIKERGGRFLVRIDENEENSPWMEVKRSISYRKVGHAFRSKARRAPPPSGAPHPPEWLIQNESTIPRSSSTGSSSRHTAQTSRRGAQADTGRRPSKHDEDFVVGSPLLTAAQGGHRAKIPSPLAKSRAQLMSGASTGVAPFIKGLDSKGTHSNRITAVNPLLRLPDRLPSSSGLTRLVQGDEDNRLSVDHATVWALQHQQQQQQQQTHLMALNNIAALEHRLAAQHDAVLALRDREQQILNLLSHQPQASGGRPGSILQGTSSLPLLQAEAAALRFQSRLPPLPTMSAAGAYTYTPTRTASTTRLFGPNVNDFLLASSTTPTVSTNQSQQRGTTSLSSSILSPLAGAFASGAAGGRGVTSNFLVDPGTTSAAELLILEQQRRRELMQRDFMASQQRSWAGAVAAAAAAHQQHHHHIHQTEAASAGGQPLQTSLTTTSTKSDVMADAGSSIRSVNKRRGDSMDNAESAATLSPSSKKKRRRRGG